jgi:signal transduction histidine kinase
VTADPRRLEQIFLNLLTNAVKFTPSGGRIEVDARLSGQSAEVRVIDTGAGIEPAFLPHVFERFRQADSATTRMVGGLGLGLFISRQLVEAQGGRLEADSKGPGCGATVHRHDARHRDGCGWLGIGLRRQRRRPSRTRRCRRCTGCPFSSSTMSPMRWK